MEIGIRVHRVQGLDKYPIPPSLMILQLMRFMLYAYLIYQKPYSDLRYTAFQIYSRFNLILLSQVSSFYNTLDSRKNRALRTHVLT